MNADGITNEAMNYLVRLSSQSCFEIYIIVSHTAPKIYVNM